MTYGKVKYYMAPIEAHTVQITKQNKISKWSGLRTCR